MDEKLLIFKKPKFGFYLSGTDFKQLLNIAKSVEDEDLILFRLQITLYQLI